MKGTQRFLVIMEELGSALQADASKTAGSQQQRRNFWRNSAPQKGQDYQYDLNITLREAYFGTERAISLQKKENCAP